MEDVQWTRSQCGKQDRRFSDETCDTAQIASIRAILWYT